MVTNSDRVQDRFSLEQQRPMGRIMSDPGGSQRDQRFSHSHTLSAGVKPTVAVLNQRT